MPVSYLHVYSRASWKAYQGISQTAPCEQIFFPIAIQHSVYQTEIERKPTWRMDQRTSRRRELHLA